MLRIISDIPLFLSLIGFLCVFPRLSIGWSCVPLPCLQACGWLWVLAAAFIASAGYWYFPSTPRASPDDGPLPLVFYGFCGTYGPFPLCFLQVMTEIVAIKPIHGANFIFETSGDAFKR